MINRDGMSGHLEAVRIQPSSLAMLWLCRDTAPDMLRPALQEGTGTVCMQCCTTVQASQRQAGSYREDLPNSEMSVFTNIQLDFGSPFWRSSYTEII